MTNEQLLTIIVSIIVPLGGLILVQSRGLRRNMAQMESRLESRIERMESQIGELRERMAHLEGLLDGLREAITRQPVA